jgi:putative endonuclease
MDAKELGRLGEQRAVWFYRMRGYAIAARNVRLRHGEIDLVVRRRQVLAFVEVKTRQSLGAGEGFEAVNQQKQLQVVRLAEEYLARYPHRGEVRYDILSLFWTGTHFIITHYPDAFHPVSDPRLPWRWTI